jgi:hypothetical protein
MGVQRFQDIFVPSLLRQGLHIDEKRVGTRRHGFGGIHKSLGLSLRQAVELVCQRAARDDQPVSRSPNARRQEDKKKDGGLSDHACNLGVKEDPIPV